MTPDKILKAKILYKEHQNYSEVARIMNVASETIRLALNERAKSLQKIRDKKRDFHSYYINKKKDDVEWYNNIVKKSREKSKDPEERKKRHLRYLQRKKLGLTGYKGLTALQIRSVNKRRYKQKNLNEEYTDNDMKYTRKLFKNKCALCDSEEHLCFDHWYPLSKGYPLSKTNAVLLCRSCNAKKHNKLPTEYLSENIVKRIEDTLYSHGKQAQVSLLSMPKL